MFEHDQVAITERIERLEAENTRLNRESRRIKLVGVSIVLCIGVVTLCAANQNGPPHIEARSIVIKDRNGVDRIFLGFNNNGAAQIQLRDNRADVQMQLVTTPDGETSALNIWDIDKKLKATVFVGRNDQHVNINGHHIR